MNGQKQRELELDFIRVVSMLMILFCHICAEAGIKWGEYFNVGVIIFLYMSGYLSGQSCCDKKWLGKRLKRILPEYYIFLLCYLIISILFFRAKYSVKQVMINLLLLQGIFTDDGLPNILHLWFVTYILICYLCTPFIAKRIASWGWKKSIALAVIMQLLIIPLRMLGIKIVFSRFAAYYMGLYTVKVRKKNLMVDSPQKIKGMAVPVLLAHVIRCIYEFTELQNKLPPIMDQALGLVWQWTHMLLGIFLFYLLWYVGNKTMMQMKPLSKKIIYNVSAKSYCIYIVHQIFVYHDYAVTRYVRPYGLGIAVALLGIGVSAYALDYLSQGLRLVIHRRKLKC